MARLILPIFATYAFVALTMAPSGARAVEREAHCLNVSKGQQPTFEGRLEHAILPGPPGYEDVRRGDRPLSVFRLYLDQPVCVWAHDDEFLANIMTDRIHLIFGEQQNLFNIARTLIGKRVTVNGVDGYGAFNGYHKAPMLISVTRIAAVPAPSALNLDPEAKTIVVSFYQALAAGDGRAASNMMVPWKRSGPFSEAAVTRFYGRLSEPLNLIEVRSLTETTFEVTYTFADGRNRCNGLARVTTARVGDLNLIEGIRSLSGC